MRRLVIFAVILFIVSRWVSLDQDESIALPVRVDIISSQKKDIYRIAFSFGNGWGLTDLQAEPPHSVLIQKRWVDRLRIVARREALDHIECVTVSIDNHRLDYPKSTLNANRTNTLPIWGTLDFDNPDNPWEFIEIPPSQEDSSFRPAQLPPVRNWPGLKIVAIAIGKSLLIWCVVFLILYSLWRYCSIDFEIQRNNIVQDQVMLLNLTIKEIVGFLTVILSLLFLEIREPYYFAQDDNALTDMPLLLFGYRSMCEGIFPDYNPYLYLGAPFASTGFFQITYPGGMISYLIARFFFGNEYLFADVYAFLHLSAGYLVMIQLGRYFGLSELIRICAAGSFVLSGPLIVIGRSWLNFCTCAVFLPLMTKELIRLRETEQQFIWMLRFGVILGIFFQVGFTQLPAFASLMCLIIAMTWYSQGLMSRRKIGVLIGGYLIAAGLAFPLLYQQTRQMDGIVRGGDWSGDICSQWHSFLLPYPLVIGSHPLNWGGGTRAHMGHMYYSGMVPVYGTLLLGLIILSSWKKIVSSAILGPVVALLLFLSLAFGKSGYLWVIGQQIPFVGSLFRYPFRLLPFISFLFIICGFSTVQSFFSMTRFPLRNQYIIAGLVILDLAWHVSRLNIAFHINGFIAYPNLVDYPKEYLNQKSFTDRFVSIYPLRSPNPHFISVFPGNTNMIVKWPRFDGNVPINESNIFLASVDRLAENPRKAMKAYGIKWICIFTASIESNGENILQTEYHNSGLYLALQNHLNLVSKGPSIRIFQLKDVDPLAFWETPSKEPLPLSMNAGGLIVDCNGRYGSIVLNFLKLPEHRAYADGKPIACTADEWNRVCVTVPPGTHRLELRLEPPWRFGLFIGSLLIGVGLLVGHACRSRSK